MVIMMVGKERLRVGVVSLRVNAPHVCVINYRESEDRVNLRNIVLMELKRINELSRN